MIGKLLGHTQVQTTARYAHLARDSVKASASKIADSIGTKYSDGNTEVERRLSVDPDTNALPAAAPFCSITRQGMMA